MALSVLIAGSTKRTVVCAQALLADPRCTILGILTPSPKPIGRKQILTKNPLHIYAEEHSIPVILIENKINGSIQEKLASFEKPDILLVVDFGYLIPQWMLSLPTIAPVNIHPSELPKYRGASPGQFVLLFGETHSAVSVIVMDSQLDHGPIIKKLPFEVQAQWTQGDYYDHAFTLAHKQLPNILSEYAQSKISEPQPDLSPTPVARHFTREDGYVPYASIQALKQKWKEVPPVPLLFSYSLPTTNDTLFNMYRALTPWPGIWTKITIDGQEKRMKILEMIYEEDRLTLLTVQIEGKTPQSFADIESVLS